jgi:hypothetical protein
MAQGLCPYARRMLQEDRGTQIRKVAAWLSGNGGTQH